jgi:hypothetical protein
MTDVGTLGGDCTQLGAINERGQIIGQASVPGTGTLTHPVL